MTTFTNNFQISYLSPVRFHKASIDVDFDTYLPKQDLMKPSIQYQRGQYPVDWYVDWDVNFELSIEMFDSTKASYFKVRNMGTNETVTVAVDIITPSDYEDSVIYLVNYTFPECGYYRLEVATYTGGLIYSDEIYVQEWSEKKNLVKIDFSDTENRNGGVFYDSSGNKIWSPCAFYSGYVRKLPATFESEEFESEMNNRFETLSTPAINSELTITDLFCQYMDNLAYQLSCDESFVNGEQISKSDFNEDSIEKSTITNVTISLSRNDNNNYQKLS